MAEVDRLSNSGLYPALPIADRRGGNDDPARRHSPDHAADKPGAPAAVPAGQGAPRSPKSIIDEYA